MKWSHRQLIDGRERSNENSPLVVVTSVRVVASSSTPSLYLFFSHFYREARAIMVWTFIPTSPILALQSQERLLQHFLRRSSFEVKTTPSQELNYVVIKTKSKSIRVKPNMRSIERSVAAPRTLVLMHGFGLGLGFFYGKFYKQYKKNYTGLILRLIIIVNR
jgi:hypothetical protein